MTEKIIILQCVDCTHDECQTILKLLRQQDTLPKHYKFILSNRKIEAIDKDELIKSLKEVIEK